MADSDVYQSHYYADVVTCKEFEGLEMPWTFTEETWSEMHLLQAIILGCIDGKTL